MDVRVVLLLSVLAQLSAAALSIRLVWITSHRLAWGLVATAVSLMAVRRMVTLGELFADPVTMSGSLSAELIALTISVCLAVGLGLIGPMFRAIKDTARDALESEARLRTLTMVSPAGLFRADCDGNFLFVSERWLNISGLSLDESLGTGWIQAVHPDDRDQVRSAWFNAIEHADPLRLEFRFRRPDGVTTWVLAQAVRDVPPDDEAPGLVGTITDINQRKIAETGLLKTQHDFERMLSVSPAVLYRCGPAPVYATEFISPNVRAQFGFEPNDLYGDPYFWIERIHADDRANVMAVLDAIKDATPRRYEYRLRRNDGSYVWLHDEFRPTVDAGRVTGMVGSWFDVTAKRAAVDALRRFEELAEATPDFVGMADANGRVSYINRSGREMLGIDQQAAVDDMMVANVHPEDVVKSVIEPALKSASDHGVWYGESALQSSDGRRIPMLQVISVHRSANGEVVYYSTVMRDITELKQAEQELRRSHQGLEQRVEQRTHDLTAANARLLEEITERQRIENALRQNEQRLNQILGTLPLALYTTSPGKTEANWVSEQFERVSGFPPELAVSEPDFREKRIHPDDAARVRAEWAKIADDGSVTTEYRWRCADNEYYWFRDQATLVRDSMGNAKQIIGTWLDITAQRQAEAALRQSEEQMSAILHNSPAVVYLKDCEGRYLFVNRKFMAMFHWTEKQIVGCSDHELFTPELAEAFHANDRYVLENRHSFEFEEVAPQDGALHTFISLKFPLYDERGEPRAVCGISTDITDRKQAEEALEQKSAELADLAGELKTVLDHTGDFVYRHDVNGIFEYVSPSIEQITGYAVNEWAKHYTTYMTDHAANSQVIGYTEKTLKTGREFPAYPVELYHKKGHRITLEVNERALWQDGKIAGIIGVARDVSERIRAEAELKRAKEAAEAASRAKSIFLANLSHEIRTPIMAIMGAAELSADRRNEHRLLERYRDTVLRNGQHLLALINDLLDVARLEAGKIDMLRRRCSLVDILANVRAATLSLPDAARVEVEYVIETPIPAQIETDPTRLAQALINLVNNALKFTERGWIRVGVAVSSDEIEPRLTIEVADTGAGIASHDSERIFATFAQAGTKTSASTTGVGLGLPLARAIAEQLGGDLTVESKQDIGSTFRLRVAIGDVSGEPRLQPDELDLYEPQPSTPQPSPDSLNIAILLAEDFQDTRELIQHALERAGASVVAVENGQEAVAAAKRQPFDLILMDVRMPVLDGREATLRIRQAGCRTPIVALTASIAPEGAGRLIASGFDDIWPKPITLADLLHRVAAFTESVPRPSTRGESAASDRRTTRHREIDAKLAAVRREFVGTLEQKVDALRTAAQEPDRSFMRERLHQLVGSAGIHGLLEISSEAARLLEIAKHGGLDGKPGAFDGLADLADRATRQR